MIAGAAGRDFHNFNVLFRNRPDVEVVAFTAAQIPDIDGRSYPPALAGPLYPQGIPIRPEGELDVLVRTERADEVLFSYSDVSHEHVMHVASRALAAGADFRLVSPASTELVSALPVVAVCAVRTGSGKSQTTRRLARLLRSAGRRVAVIRHPMPYGELTRQAVQRFARHEDLDEAACTIEEREEFEPHLDEGSVVFAGVDYAAILEQSEREADVLLWDGGNNDTPFLRPSLHVVVLDPHRPGHELRYHPGETNLRLADVCVVNKVDSAPPEGVDAVLEAIRALNPRATIVLAASPYEVEGGLEQLRGKRVLAVEDGPTLTHGEMTFGAAALAARDGGAARVTVLPALGYGKGQIDELRDAIARSDADVVLIGTPTDLRRLIELDKPALRVRYRLEELGEPTLADVLAEYGLVGAAAAA